MAEKSPKNGHRKSLHSSENSRQRAKTIRCKTLEIEQLAHFSPEEIAAIEELADTLARETRAPTDEELKLLREKHRATDISLFGRMLAEKPVI